MRQPPTPRSISPPSRTHPQWPRPSPPSDGTRPTTHLPAALRAFLLTLAVVDDLGAILIIALFFTSDLNLWALAGAFAGLVVFYVLQRARVRGWWWYVPLGVTVWVLMYNGGVHATVAGVAMGLILRTHP